MGLLPHCKFPVLVVLLLCALAGQIVDWSQGIRQGRWQAGRV